MKIPVILYTINEHCIIDNKIYIIFNTYLAYLFHKIMVYVANLQLIFLHGRKLSNPYKF